MRKDVKQVLYAVIDDIGREKIRADVSSDIESSKKYCAEIMKRCMRDLGDEANDDETLGNLCEALLHFMLTASLLPSERKVTVDGMELDIVVPSVKSLAKNPDKTLVIQVVKTSADLAKVKQAQAVQKNAENLWIISARKIEYKGRNYHLGNANLQYSSAVSDIHAFLARKGVSSLKMLHG
ncbi:hypothetical protein NTE_01811 [Candidatus Nitrososphaera evergladensis SR1]|uniref:Uncharacterized protein n=1 Tax=Candidatus Nitrososphaera evergladensis SR1 TaxID=1459636 RepID=A0A075MSV8_9ARCH|nr:hypothetical protein [Candidatus Nitrososphaera evergladensis]AIF83872.1 hypothetical protein NTE_01811 [Candidatus Nitrososphaera evergladensis SR1]